MAWYHVSIAYGSDENNQRMIREALLGERRQTRYQRLEDGTSQYFLERKDGNYVLEISRGTEPIDGESSYSIAVVSADESVVEEEFERADKIIDEHSDIKHSSGVWPLAWSLAGRTLPSNALEGQTLVGKTLIPSSYRSIN